MNQQLKIQTSKQLEFIDITSRLKTIVTASGVSDGILYVYSLHTSCGLTIQENTDPGVGHDILLLLDRAAPQSDAAYQHNENNSASHFQTSFMGTHQIVFIENGKMILGRWQAVFLTEFDGPRERTLLVKIQPDR